MSERKSRVPASPKVRKFARELGLDIDQIIGSKREGRPRLRKRLAKPSVMEGTRAKTRT